MKEIIADIRRKLQDGSYRNEEHVRFALVGRLLQALGWDIWNPQVVNAEFVAVPEEDNKKVDLALFSRGNLPAVFIEVKNIGKATLNREETEKQIRDYNKNITALFCVITDGVTWRFYYSKSQGQFASKCFKDFDLLNDDLDDVELSLLTFLGKADIDNGNAEKEAQALLRLTQNQKIMEECLAKARRMTQEPPFPSLPDALIALVAAPEHGLTVSRKEAEEFISSAHNRVPVVSPSVTREPHAPVAEPPRVSTDNVVSLTPERPASLAHTSIESGVLGGERADNWNALVCAGIKLAIAKGYDISQIRRWVNGQVEEGSVIDRGFHPVPGTKVSLQYMDANRAWENALALAKQLKCEIRVDFHWRRHEAAAYPGQAGLLHWKM